MDGLIRYDGTRFITEEEVDREFTGQWVLVSVKDERQALAREGQLIATADDRQDLLSKLEEIAILEFDSMATIIYGCETRGNFHFQLLNLIE